jgi:hypothetical protein
MRPDGGGSKDVWNVCQFVQQYTAQRAKKPKLSQN